MTSSTTFIEHQKIGSQIIDWSTLAIAFSFLLLTIWLWSNEGFSSATVIIFISTILLFGSYWLIKTLKLVTSVANGEITIEFRPFMRKRISLTQIETASVTTYSSFGYGIQKNAKYGTVYNAHGNQGVLLKLSSEKNILIGSQKSQILLDAIKNAPS